MNSYSRLTANTGTASTAVRETAEFIASKFGRGVTGQSVKEVTESTAKAVARHGSDALHSLGRLDTQVLQP